MMATLSDEILSSTTTTVDLTFCSLLDDNATQRINRLNQLHAQSRRPIIDGTTSTPVHVDVARVINDVGVPIVAIFGILGNALNLAVLTRKRLQRKMADRLETSAHAGLVALAASDALVCLTYAAVSLLLRFQSKVYGRDQSLVILYFDVYREPLLNVFQLTSTWLTVVMAVERYVAVCRPLQARSVISLTGTRVAILSVSVASLVCNLPRFWHYVPGVMPCSKLLDVSLREAASVCANVALSSCRYYLKLPGTLYNDHPTFVLVYDVFYFTVNIVLPLPILTFCNVCLVSALRRSHRLRQQQLQQSRGIELSAVQSIQQNEGININCQSDANNSVGATTLVIKSSHERLTRTLIGLIMLLIFLVGPSEILAFFRNYVINERPKGAASSRARYSVYHTATAIVNFLLLINYAVNFVLYCIVNPHFRRTCWDMVTCQCLRTRRRRGSCSMSEPAGPGCSRDGKYCTSVQEVMRGKRMRCERMNLMTGAEARLDVSSPSCVDGTGGVGDGERREDGSSVAVTIL